MSPLQLSHLDALTPLLLSATAEVPFYAASVARARLSRSQQALSAALKSPRWVPASACVHLSCLVRNACHVRNEDLSRLRLLRSCTSLFQIVNISEAGIMSLSEHVIIRRPSAFEINM